MGRGRRQFGIVEIIGILIAVFGVLLMVLTMGQFYGSEWEETGTMLAGATVIVVMFAIVVSAIFYYARKGGRR